MIRAARGVASGGDGSHSGPLLSVGLYLDEQPITTIQGSLDVRLYDIARVEALAGPQGTLYGVSSQAGTIPASSPNKPDPSSFSAAWGIEGNTVSKGGTDYLDEGYVNLPLGEKSAIRLVGWARRDAGFIELNNRNPTPFAWTKTADEILESLKRFRLRTSETGHQVRKLGPQSPNFCEKRSPIVRGGFVMMYGLTPHTPVVH